MIARALLDDFAGCPSGITLRPITTEDMPFLRDLYAETRAEELAMTAWTDEFKNALIDHQFGAQHAYYHDVFAGADFLLVQRDGEAIGRIYVHRAPSEISVLDIALIPQQRNQGLGSALLAEVIAEARREGVRIALYVEATNPARRMYDRLGFVLIETGDVYDLLHLEPSAVGLS
ncbi:GNAT family N-acetyltransferase [Pseudolysobacter antarcticus]|uniref:GNAT family N-acetyltransferase n=1 Tax=Pseudolysobacter antarcticus TaxID=2511995 RepID=A0A411HN45_9GAMM|nr:GNAT family N-acetyltransferase [Pseudolysobacter antarcticus]QBB71915.1 GNAT family N-acetyltransferase [Pseudolysobacter antarcticus]